MSRCDAVEVWLVAGNKSRSTIVRREQHEDAGIRSAASVWELVRQEGVDILSTLLAACGDQG